MPLLSPGLIHCYNGLWRTLKPEAGDREAHKIVEGHRRYLAVQRATQAQGGPGVPWYLVGILHSLESNFSFGGHLHNGDPLERATINVPAGRGPFATWEESAVDALHLKRRLWSGFAWGAIHEHLLALELYNGLGYLLSHPDVNSPYLWGLTNHHHRGKYTSDGKFDASAITRQAGGAAILWHLLRLFPSLMPTLRVETVERSGPVTGPDAGRWEVARLQAYLNSLPGERITVDGRWGPQTAGRFAAVFDVAA
ncbi:MAG: hypothetical protein BWZ08_02307 [candidate division BRC1 bacterium ADurb.BinA292]|nr:MAG: hypothetical protein BWZ08_02307 [candidate division BRC1 bacterium ADurb.BinA292]